MKFTLHSDRIDHEKYFQSTQCLPLPMTQFPPPSKTLFMEVGIELWKSFATLKMVLVICIYEWMIRSQNFHITGPKKALDARVESNLQKSMLVPVNYDDPVKQVTRQKYPELRVDILVRFLPFPRARSPSTPSWILSHPPMGHLEELVGMLKDEPGAPTTFPPSSSTKCPSPRWLSSEETRYFGFGRL